MSRSPAIRSRSSSVRSPHHFLTSPRICFHLPFKISEFIVHLFSLENCLGTSAAPPRGLPPRSDRSPWAALYTGESKRDARPPERAPPDCPLRRVAPRGDRDSPTLSASPGVRMDGVR